jgi:DNA-binding LacI/PurR family transcriptional regulator
MSMVTMNDIAKKAGVSRSTASGVINNHDAKLRISSETRLRVLEASRELGYLRNELARSVAAGNSYVIGFLKRDKVEQEAFILDGVLQAASESGYLVKVLIQGEEEHFDDVVRRCVEYRLAGLILRRFSIDEINSLCEGMTAYKIPFIFTDDTVSLPGIGSVTSDDSHGVYLAVDHLLSLGHVDMAFLAGDCGHPQGFLRRLKFLERMNEVGITVPDEWVCETKWEITATEQLTSRIFRAGVKHPTALMCDGDNLAAGAMRTLWNLGYRVPQDVSVTGYAGSSYGEMLHPPLTTVVQPFSAMGRVAMHRLLKVISARQNGEIAEDLGIELLPTRLVVRSSTAPPPAASSEPR